LQGTDKIPPKLIQARGVAVLYEIHKHIKFATRKTCLCSGYSYCIHL